MTHKYGEVGKDGFMKSRENCRSCGRPFDALKDMVGFSRLLGGGLCPKCLSKSGPLKPSKKDEPKKCYYCNGTGRIKNYKCVKCNGTGK